MRFTLLLLSCFSCSSTVLVCVCVCTRACVHAGILIDRVEADKRNSKNKVEHKDSQRRTLSDSTMSRLINAGESHTRVPFAFYCKKVGCI